MYDEELLYYSLKRIASTIALFPQHYNLIFFIST